MHVDGLIEAAGWWSYVLVFAVTAGETGAFIGLLVPGETIILLASAIAGRGDLNAVVLAAAVVAGGMAGDNLGYALVYAAPERAGRPVPARPPDRADPRLPDALRRGGGVHRTVHRFRTNLPVSAAGASNMPHRRFFLYSTAASLVWGVGNVLLGYFAGTAATEFLHSVGLITAAALAAAAVADGVVNARGSSQESC
ncbi:DedA family protein [Streptomyces sp. NPDC001984]|uniref:DedA family protein n=1 Tax=Streptomyces sp. NPDC002619 TaxID=3364655 RepID=UPI0036A4E5AF